MHVFESALWGAARVWARLCRGSAESRLPDPIFHGLGPWTPGREDARVGFGGAMWVPADCKESSLSLLRNADSKGEEPLGAPCLSRFPKGDAVLWWSQQVAPVTPIPLFGDRFCVQFQGLNFIRGNKCRLPVCSCYWACKILGKWNRGIIYPVSRIFFKTIHFYL